MFYRIVKYDNLRDTVYINKATYYSFLEKYDKQVEFILFRIDQGDFYYNQISQIFQKNKNF